MNRYLKAILCIYIFLLAFLSMTKAEETQEKQQGTPQTYTVVKDIRYGLQRKKLSPNDHSSDRLLDLYLPDKKKPEKGFPVFVFIHGGGFTGGDKVEANGLNPICKAIVQKGFAVISINYFLTMKYHHRKGVSCESQMKNGIPVNHKFHPLIRQSIKNASLDAISALEWLKTNATKYNLNIHSVFLCGGSAGAITALHTTYVECPTFIKIKGVINLWGAMENPSMITAPAPPIFTFHGDCDDVISVEYGHAIQQRMRNIGDTISRFQILEGKGHAQYSYIATNYINDIIYFLNSQLKQ